MRIYNVEEDTSNTALVRWLLYGTYSPVNGELRLSSDLSLHPYVPSATHVLLVHATTDDNEWLYDYIVMNHLVSITVLIVLHIKPNTKCLCRVAHVHYS